MQHRDLDMKYNTHWSQLYQTDMGQHVARLMETPHRQYHNIVHVQRLYRHAKRLQVPYNINLDCAILWHDAIYDSEPEKEYRSAEAMREMAKAQPEWFAGVDINEAATLIVNTIEHVYTPQVNPWMIRLDTVELSDPDLRYENFWSLMAEARELYGIDNPTAAQGTIDFMEHFRETLLINAERDFDFVLEWSQAAEGCTDVITMAKVTTDIYKRVNNV
jgi:predicted metal-dependent HD superfamily phosphohydrolase